MHVVTKILFINRLTIQIVNQDLELMIIQSHIHIKLTRTYILYDILSVAFTVIPHKGSNYLITSKNKHPKNNLE